MHASHVCDASVWARVEMRVQVRMGGWVRAWARVEMRVRMHMRLAKVSRNQRTALVMVVCEPCDVCNKNAHM